MTNKIHGRVRDISNDLHRKIVNINMDGASQQYKLGHRDARHEAANLASEANKKFGDLLDEVVETYVVAMVVDHEIIVDVASTEEQAEKIVLSYVQTEYDYEGDTYDVSDISDHIGSMGDSMTWTIKKKMNPHFMDVSQTLDEEADNTASFPSP
ncbi:hypothetical protein [Sulfitobacter sp. R18_1]|uniref:hypothetical protein n=1 Tax=Sulfitobacter sp. R18_1 TaxID=2821104 RepID=UPI001ADB5330|nr:hypothetical protein [Sulfitobacter sp. R18_1]MBO9427943.1 hypothetical protein [Sulfitobacter sp. R18_1]